MRAEILDFRSALLGAKPAHTKPARDFTCYIGTVTALRADGRQRIADLWTHKLPALKHSVKWDPYLTIVSEDGQYSCYQLGLSTDIDCTENQWALFYFRDHIRDNWWPIVNRVGFAE